MWTVETLNTAVDAEVNALPKDLRARLSHISALIEATGFENIPADYVKHLEGKLGIASQSKERDCAGDLCDSDRKARDNRKSFRKEDPKDATQGTRHSPRKGKGAG